MNADVQRVREQIEGAIFDYDLRGGTDAGALIDRVLAIFARPFTDAQIEAARRAFDGWEMMEARERAWEKALDTLADTLEALRAEAP